MPKRRSSSTVSVVGVLNLIAGCLGLIVTLVSALGLFLIYSGTAAPSADPLDTMAVQNHIRAVRPEYRFVEAGDFAFGFLLDVMLIASGVGLLYRKPWARILALTWALMSGFKRLMMTAYTMLAVVPTMSAYYEATLARMNVPAAQASSMKVGASAGGYGAACMSGLLIAYPIIIFCLLMSPSSKAACKPRAFDDDYDEDYEEDYDDRDRGRSRRRGRDHYEDDRDDRGRW